MKTLERQLADYGELQAELHPPIAPDELTVRPETLVSTRRTPRWLYAAAAVVVIGLFVGGVAWLTGGNPEEDVIEQTTTTTIPTPTTATTGVLESEDPIVDETQSLVTSLGTLTWSKVEGGKSSLPSGWLKTDAGSGYIAYEGAYPERSGQEQSLVWRSEDAVTWTSEPIPALAGYSNVMFEIPSWTDTSEEIAWALAHTEETSTLFQARDSWVPVVLPEPPLPPLSGVEWTIRPEWLIESGEAIVVPAFGSARIPWENYYGTRNYNGFEAPNWPEWDESSQVIQFFDSSETTLLAELTLGVVGDTLVFTDVDTGAVVHEVGGISDYLPDLIQDDGDVDFSILDLAGVWVSPDGEPFEYQEAPWSGPRYKPEMVLPLPTGGFAAFFVLNSDGRVGDVEVWTSEDGVTWLDHGAAAFLDDGSTAIEDVFIRPWIAGLRAEVLYPSGAFQAWESTDGLTWSPESVLPPETRVYETAFGYVAVSMSDYPAPDPNGRFFKFWISDDGVIWEPVEGPPGKHEPDGGGGSLAGAAGDVIYLSVAQDGGSRFMWIGRIEPP